MSVVVDAVIPYLAWNSVDEKNKVEPEEAQMKIRKVKNIAHFAANTQ